MNTFPIKVTKPLRKDLKIGTFFMYADNLFGTVVFIALQDSDLDSDFCYSGVSDLEANHEVIVIGKATFPAVNRKKILRLGEVK